MSEHVEQPETDDVEGHFQIIDGEGRAQVPPTRRMNLVDAGDDDVEGHVLDLDIERRR
jgi:hypothetical protein